MQEIDNDDIDLNEVFSALISGWKSLIMAVSFSFVGSVYYALNVPSEKFESFAKIQLSQVNNRSRFSDFSGIASLAGVSLPDTNGDQIQFETRLNSRKFILGLDQQLDLFSDEYLNPNNEQNSKIAVLKAHFLALVRNDANTETQHYEHADLTSKVEYQVVRNFRSNLRIEERDGGLLEVFFKHTSPNRSAEILNVAIEEAIKQIDIEKKEAAWVRLDYLEDELTRIQEELEAAVDAMQKYAVEYNVGSIQDLASSSFRTDSLRDELKVLRDTRTAIEHLSLLDSFTSQHLSEARIKYPFIRTLDFRSRLSLPADINSWAKPSVNTFLRAQSRVTGQIEDLTALISDMEKKARNTATEAKMFGELQRNITVKETLYEVLIKQFESQSLSAGLPGKSVEFFDPGVPPLEKTEPKRALIVSMGLVLGLLLGSAFVLVRAMLTGVIYSKRAMITKIKKFGTLIKLSGVQSTCGRDFLRSLGIIRLKFQKYRSLTSFLDPSQIICGVVSTHNEANARCIGLVLMQGMRRYSERVQLLDLNSIFKLNNVSKANKSLLGQVSLLALENDCEVIQPCSEVTPYELKQYIEKMKLAGTAVLILFDNLEVKQNELMFLSNSMDNIFFGVRAKKTTKVHLEVIGQILSKHDKPGAMVYC